MKIQKVFFVIATLIAIIPLSIGCKEKKCKNHPVANDSIFAYTSLDLALWNGGKSISLDILSQLKDSCIRFGINPSEPILILRYSRYSCEPCVEFAVTEFEHFVNNKSFKQYLTIVSDFQKRDLPKNRHLINLEKRDLGIPMDKCDIPYICIVNGGVINSMIMPDKKYQKYLDFYFHRIESLSLIK
ncbi:MAG: hypothetical protein IJX44_08090 [Bacteroidaceae bacterium]|nr:hypothetical protein [Bacteroidaceae bacterium]